MKRNLGAANGKAGPRHFTVSAKTGDNVPNLFYYMAEIFTFGLPEEGMTHHKREEAADLKPVQATVTEYEKDDKKQPAIKDSLKQEQCVVS